MLRFFKSFRTSTRNTSTSATDQPRTLCSSIKLIAWRPWLIFSSVQAPDLMLVPGLTPAHQRTERLMFLVPRPRVDGPFVLDLHDVDEASVGELLLVL